MKLKNAKKGFTLVEIMIVVAIIALLAVIAVPSFVQARLKAQASSCKNNLRQIDGAKDQFALDNANTAPTALGDLVPDYVKNTPLCPAAGTVPLPPGTDRANRRAEIHSHQGSLSLCAYPSRGPVPRDFSSITAA